MSSQLKSGKWQVISGKRHRMASRLPLVALLFFFAGCGFHPMYGDSAHSASSALRGNINIDSLSGHEGQIFKIALEDKFNPEGVSTAGAPYRLHITLTKILIPAIIKSDGTIQRYNVRFTSQFQLYKAGTVKPVFTGKLLRSGDYNAAVNANFATYEAEQDITERTLQELAEDYVIRISTYLESRSADSPAPDAGSSKTESAVQHNQ